MLRGRSSQVWCLQGRGKSCGLQDFDPSQGSLYLSNAAKEMRFDFHDSLAQFTALLEVPEV